MSRIVENWFAWRPVRLWHVHREPEGADPLVKALYNGWTTTGRWAWLRRVRRFRTLYGETFYTEPREPEGSQ